jgi:hypothetical protein
MNDSDRERRKWMAKKQTANDRAGIVSVDRTGGNSHMGCLGNGSGLGIHRMLTAAHLKCDPSMSAYVDLAVNQDDEILCLDEVDNYAKSCCLVWIASG